MNPQLQTLLDFFQQNKTLTAEEKLMLEKTIKKAKSDFEISEFKLERTEKVKRTTAILLEETIEELEQKRKAVEAQNKELEIEAALERVRIVAMSMHKSEEVITVCEAMYKELMVLGFTNIRNSQIAIKNDAEQSYSINSYSSDEVLVMGEAPYKSSPIVEELYNELGKSKDAFYKKEFSGKEFEGWRKWRESLSALKDEREKAATSLCFYLYSIGEGHLGISTYNPITEEQEEIIKRFKNVFKLSYQRYSDVAKAEAQAREAQIQLALERVRARTMAMQKQNDLLGVLDLLVEQLVKLGVDLQVANFSNGIPGGDWDLWIEVVAGSGTIFNNYVHFPRIEHPYFHHVEKNIETYRKDRTDLFKDVFSKEDKDSWQDYINTQTIIKDLQSEEINPSMYDKPGFTWSMIILKDTWVSIGRFNTIPFSDEEDALLRRFANAFGQAYTRFLDLQKAEAQAREAEIQLALERVRARTMAMQKSEELAEAAEEMFKQVNALGAPEWSCGFDIFDQDEKSVTQWISGGHGLLPPFKTPLTEHSFFKTQIEARHQKTDFLIMELGGQELKDLYDYIFQFPDAKKVFDQIKYTGLVRPEFQVMHFAFFSQGYLLFITYEPVPEMWNIFKRFAKVFEQTYTRFLDLQKAEAQARESQIELGLERVRARAMAMQTSEELNALIGTVFTELIKLELVLTRSVIIIYEPDGYGCRWWMANSESPSRPMNFLVGYAEQPFFEAYRNGWQEKNLKWVFELKGEDKIKTDNFLFSKTELSQLPDFVIAGMKAPEKVWLSSSFNNFGCLTLASLEPLPDEHFDILLRFAKVFDSTYTRFNDLQKAEAQAREAKIEAALERVRAKTMAMYKSENLNTVTEVVFNELEKLELGILRCGIGIINKEKRSADAWITSVSDEGKTVQVSGTESMDLHPLLQGVYDAWLANSDFSYVLEGEDLVQYYKTSGVGKVRLPDSQLILSADEITTQYYQIAVFEAGGLFAFRANDFPEKAKIVMKRFAAVFNQSYTRFLDLQKAEAQTREAKIEASLERVRGKAMSMHSSRDLADTIEVFYREIELLSITPRRCGVGLIDKETHFAEVSTMNTTEQRDSIEIIGKVKLTGHPVLEGIYDNWILQKEYHPVLRGDEIKQYYQLIRPQIAYPDYPTDMTQYGYFFFFNEGSVYAWTEKELSEDELKIYRRFTSVLSLTYKRYKDLKDAEANTREAIKRASLDRVRAETASMRTTGDLERITPLIWNELTTLGVPFIRSGVFIMDEKNEQIHSFLSTPDGKAIAAFQLPYDSAGELSKVLSHWHKNEIFKDHWNEATFAEWAKSLVNQGAIASEEQYSTAHRPVNLDLHFLPFLQGMLYVGSEAPLSEEEIHLVQSLADAFSTAYARYEDFNKLESAKKQIEKTLVDLKQAQAQLVQSEKMASLGELTAGIAHEIQNPLNFVNNFSEVNKELLFEMKDEMSKGNMDDANAIADDVIENSEKINHHGKRAGDIVKGMLQHSRVGTGTKEPTDINALADEYLRLSYHGLRAKDKEFNATMKTDFDETIGKINMIPQDIGRVFLNLYNNAFYAVNEQKNRNVISLAKEVTPFQKVSPLYEPTVSVSTKKSDNHVIITVSDNGNGIPQNIVDKIFQPFFTTKPTGSGTGLGLSLSYDIVKAHGGEIRVESFESEATLMALPDGEQHSV